MIWKLFVYGLVICLIILGCEQNEGENFNYALCSIEWSHDTYDFPIKPGMDEWSLLTTSRAMDSVLLMPDSILQNISTEGLIQTCMNYPRWFDLFFSYNYNFQRGFEILYSNFNGLQELLNRSDAGHLLYTYYNQMHPECNESNWSRVLGPSFTYAWIEIIIAQYQILEQFDTEEMELLCSYALQTYKKKNLLDYSIFTQKTSLLISGRIMKINEFAPFVQEYNANNNLKIFIDYSVLNGHFEILNVIEILTKDYLSN